MGSVRAVYVVCVAAVIVALATATPVLAARGQHCFISHGCWGGFHKETQRRVADLMAKVASQHKAKFIIAAGDNFYKHGVESVDDPLFRTGFENVYTNDSLQVPWVVALGNHDYEGDPWAQVAYSNKSSRWVLPHPYHAHFDRAASVAVIVLDTQVLEACEAKKNISSVSAERRVPASKCWDKKGEQLKWAAAQLARATRDGYRWKVIVGHHPLYANGPHANHEFLRAAIDPLLVRFSVQLYINADNHYLQASRRAWPKRPQREGTWYLNTGGGGGLALHSPERDKRYRTNKHNKFVKFDTGVMLHCASTFTNRLTTSVFSVKGGAKAPIFTFHAEGDLDDDGNEESTKPHGVDPIIVPSHSKHPREELGGGAAGDGDGAAVAHALFLAKTAKNVKTPKHEGLPEKGKVKKEKIARTLPSSDSTPWMVMTLVVLALGVFFACRRVSGAAATKKKVAA